MARNSRGSLSGNTKKLRKRRRDTVTDIVKSFKIGESIVVSVKPNIKGAPNLRFQGRRGQIKGIRGKCYLVEVKDGNSKKELIASSLHLKKL